MITPLKAKLSEYKVRQTNIELTAHLILKIMLNKFYYKSNQKIINIQILRDSVIQGEDYILLKFNKRMSKLSEVFL